MSSLRIVPRTGASPGAFELGTLSMTPGVRLEVPVPHVLCCIARHARGDWGDLDADDCAVNQRALADGSRIFSAYNVPTANGPRRVYVITDAKSDDGHRESTTVLLPEEY